MWKIKLRKIVRSILFIVFLAIFIMLIVFAFLGYAWFCVPALMVIAMWYCYATAGEIEYE
jgi:hypothetical protein